MHGYLVLRQPKVLDDLADALLLRTYKLEDAKPCGVAQSLEESRGYSVEGFLIFYQALDLISAVIDMIDKKTRLGKGLVGEPVLAGAKNANGRKAP